MIYIEKQPSRQSVVLLVMLSLVLYLGALMLPELNAGDEALNAAIARDMAETGDFLQTRLYGQPVRYFPMYSWLVVLCSGFRGPSVFTLRLPALLALGGLALLAGLMAWRMKGVFAGWIAAAVVLTSVVGFRVGCRAQTEILQAFFLFAAWSAWYWYGYRRSCRALGWGLAHALVFLAVLTVGSGALFWFYLPLFCLRFSRKAKGELTEMGDFQNESTSESPRLEENVRLDSPEHLISALILSLVIAGWLFNVPMQPFMPWSVEPSLQSSVEPTNYLWHLIFFPWKSVLYLGAWSLLVWSPFCIALRQFEEARYGGDRNGCLLFRTVVLSIGVLIWLCPNTTPMQLLPAFAPLAVLIGVHFEIVIRRHQHILNRILRAVAWGICVCGLILAVVWLCMAQGVLSMTCQMPPQRMTVICRLVSLLLGLTVLLVWFLILRKQSKVTFRSCIIWCIFGVRVLTLCSAHSLHVWKHSDRRLAGEALAGMLQSTEAAATLEAVALPAPGQKTLQDMKDEAKVIYYLPNREFNYLYLVETFYLGRPVIRVNDLATDLPDTVPSVYVLSSRVPALATRNWEPVSPVVDMAMRRTVRRSDLNFQELPWLTFSRAASDGDGYVPRPLLIYRGTLK